SHVRSTSSLPIRSLKMVAPPRGIGPNIGPKLKNTAQYSRAFGVPETSEKARKYGRSDTQRYSM
ncbi:MAG: hypothetical protein WAK72_00545, partial [Pseudolabrys sp.]